MEGEDVLGRVVSMINVRSMLPEHEQLRLTLDGREIFFADVKTLDVGNRLSNRLTDVFIERELKSANVLHSLNFVNSTMAEGIVSSVEDHTKVGMRGLSCCCKALVKRPFLFVVSQDGHVFILIYQPSSNTFYELNCRSNNVSSGDTRIALLKYLEAVGNCFLQGDFPVVW